MDGPLNVAPVNRAPNRCSELVDHIRGCGPSAVAFSAGVDSTVVAKAAQLALGNQTVAVTAHSPSVASGELEQARELAERIGIRHKVIETSEMEDARYVRNATDRCYYCKTTLYSRLDELLGELQVKLILNGVNVDDLGDYRPGLRAAEEHRVRSPLAELQLTKADVRQLAAAWELPVWDKPATPCLASRIAYGEEVTVERLRMIDRAESYLKDRGLREIRVRYHRDGLARVEVPAAQIQLLLDDAFRTELTQYLIELGFRYVTLDLSGFRSGSMNQVIPLRDIRT